MIKFQANKLNLSNEQISIRIKTRLKCYFNNLKSNNQLSRSFYIFENPSQCINDNASERKTCCLEFWHFNCPKHTVVFGTSLGNTSHNLLSLKIPKTLLTTAKL